SLHGRISQDRLTDVVRMVAQVQRMRCVEAHDPLRAGSGRRSTSQSDQERTMNEFKLLIDGKLVAGAATLDVINPATEEILVAAPRADIAQLNGAVAAAKAAFPAWSGRPVWERGAFLGWVADALEARKDEFERLLTLEQGKPLSEAAWEIGFSID